LAKTSQIARENKRKRLVEKYSQKRKELKSRGDYEALAMLPNNSNPIRLHNRCAVTVCKRILQKFGMSRLTLKIRRLRKNSRCKKVSW
jgi:small subunit ribosomal protein S14